MQNRYFIILVAAFSVACSSSSAPSDEDARAAYELFRSRSRLCSGQIVAFRKVNGAEKTFQGMKYYAVEFEAEENKSSCRTLMWQTKSDKLVIGGEVYLIKTEKGWKGDRISCGEKVGGEWVHTAFCDSGEGLRPSSV